MTITPIAPFYSPQMIRRIFASGAIGNIIETYDLILVSLMATTLSKVFFPPSSDPYAHIMDVLYVFLIGLLIRPIGNIIMGLFADQVGRKKLMVISLIFTGIGTALIGLIPSYYYIGIWSTILFITLRIFQNFFVGIEYINSATYLIENSQKTTRGFYTSWTAIGISALTMMGAYLSFIYYIYIPIHLITTRHFSHNEVFSLNVLSLSLVVLLIPLFGKLSDYYNRVHLLRVICFSILILALPFFWFSAYGTYYQILFISLLISIPASCFFSLYPAIITESFPSKIRCTAASLIYQIVVSLEMATLPLLINYLIKETKNPYSPGYLLIISTFMGLVALQFLKKMDAGEEKNTNVQFLLE